MPVTSLQMVNTVMFQGKNVSPPVMSFRRRSHKQLSPCPLSHDLLARRVVTGVNTIGSEEGDKNNLSHTGDKQQQRVDLTQCWPLIDSMAGNHHLSTSRNRPCYIFIWCGEIRPNCGMNTGNSSFSAGIVNGAVAWMVCCQSWREITPPLILAAGLKSLVHSQHWHPKCPCSFHNLDWWQLEKAGYPSQIICFKWQIVW